MSFITNNLASIMFVIGLAVFLVAVITQVTKNIDILKKIPTDLQVIVLSIIICMVGYLAYAAYSNTAVTWYYVVGSFFGAFIVAFVSMYGWSKLKDLFKRLVAVDTGIGGSTAENTAENTTENTAENAGVSEESTDDNTQEENTGDGTQKNL